MLQGHLRERGSTYRKKKRLDLTWSDLDYLTPPTRFNISFFFPFKIKVTFYLGLQTQYNPGFTEEGYGQVPGPFWSLENLIS